MIVTFKAGTPQSQIDSLIRWLQSQGVQAHWSAGEYHTVLALVGETGSIDPGLLSSLEIVQSVKQISQPFQCCSREFQPQNTVVSLGASGFGLGTAASASLPVPVLWKVKSKSYR